MSDFPRNDPFGEENPSAKVEHARVSALNAKTLSDLLAALQEWDAVAPKFIDDAMKAAELILLRADAMQKAAPTDNNKKVFGQIVALHDQMDRKRGYRPD